MERCMLVYRIKHEQEKLNVIPKYEIHMVSRLDQPTSGALILPTTRSAEAEAYLTECFKNHEVQKTYLCLCLGHQAYLAACWCVHREVCTECNASGPSRLFLIP